MIEPFETYIRNAWYAWSRFSYDICTLDLFKLLFKAIAQTTHASCILFHGFARFFERHSQAYDAWHVFRARTTAALLTAAVHDRLGALARTAYQRADSLGAMELVRRNRQHIDPQRFGIEAHVPSRLHGIGMEK